MPIYYGSDRIGKVYFGTVPITKVYHGATLVFGGVEGPTLLISLLDELIEPSDLLLSGDTFTASDSLLLSGDMA